MENILYSAVIVPAKESPDGETPTMLYVCQETNAIVVWLESYDDGLVYLRHSRTGRNEMIEWGVHAAEVRQEEYYERKANKADQKSVIERAKAVLAQPTQPGAPLTDQDIPF